MLIIYMNIMADKKRKIIVVLSQIHKMMQLLGAKISHNGQCLTTMSFPHKTLLAGKKCQ